MQGLFLSMYSLMLEIYFVRMPLADIFTLLGPYTV